ncbi:MAG: CHAT domain-containing protein [Pseudomonadota bacterium]
MDQCRQGRRRGQEMKAHAGPVPFLSIISIVVVLLLVAPPVAVTGEDGSGSGSPAVTPRKRPPSPSSTADDEQSGRYRWLFRKDAEAPTEPVVPVALLDRLDREIKNARKLYLSGELENGILKYRSAIDQFESILDDLPPGDPLLLELSRRLTVFEELVGKILGPIHGDPKPELAGQVFHVMEKRRLCRRNLVLKKAGMSLYHDVPESLLKDEAEILGKLRRVRQELRTGATVREEEALKTKLALVRRSLHKSSARFSALRTGGLPSLTDVRRDLAAQNDMILDIGLFRDRMIIGVITAESAVYHQLTMNPADLSRQVFNLLDKLKESSAGESSSFMGHAWKEPCRRVYRSIFGGMRPLPSKERVFIIPDRSLWYLPFSAILDGEDRPFGQERLVSLIPSVEMLRFSSRSKGSTTSLRADKGLVLYESIPVILEDGAADSGRKSSGTKKKAAPKISEGERIERLVLANPVSPNASEAACGIQKLFKDSDVRVGPAATADAFTKRQDIGSLVSIMAVPLPMTDIVAEDRQPSLIFSPDGSRERRLPAVKMTVPALASKLAVFPMSWIDVQDREVSEGEGPLLVSLVLSYLGTPAVMVNYSNPEWGGEDPFLTTVLTKSLEKGGSIGRALAEYDRDMQTGPRSSFSGKPPAWAGWILMGDPGGAPKTGAAPE